MKPVPTTLRELQSRVRAGWRPTYIFFWNGDPERYGSVGAECLSQWYPAAFVQDGRRFPTAEHYMMFSKAHLFADSDAESQILRAPSPAVAKRLGRTVRNFSEAIWVQHRSEIVLRASVAKFSQNERLRAYLLGTKARVLAEASPVDRVWGIGLGADDDHARNPIEWRGLNLLGFALMRARELLSGDGRHTPA